MWEVLQLQQGATTLEVYYEYDQLQRKNIVGHSPKMMKKIVLFCFVFTVKSIKHIRNCEDIRKKSVCKSRNDSLVKQVQKFIFFLKMEFVELGQCALMNLSAIHPQCKYARISTRAKCHL